MFSSTYHGIYYVYIYCVHMMVYIMCIYIMVLYIMVYIMCIFLAMSSYICTLVGKCNVTSICTGGRASVMLRVFVLW